MLLPWTYPKQGTGERWVRNHSPEIFLAAITKCHGHQVTGYISNKSGKNLKPIFEQYLKYHNLPVLEFATVNKQLNFRWIADAKDFNMPVLIRKRDGQYQLLSPSNKFEPVNITGITKDNLVIDTANYYIRVLLD